jgi:hypothetical protein
VRLRGAIRSIDEERVAAAVERLVHGVLDLDELLRRVTADGDQDLVHTGEVIVRVGRRDGDNQNKRCQYPPSKLHRT